MKHWKILSKVKSGEIINILLQNRGLTTKKQIEEFLNPPNPYLPAEALAKEGTPDRNAAHSATGGLNPSALGFNQKELIRAVRRIKKGIDSGERIIVYGDYDADGICGTAILWETLNSLGAQILPYIPHRVEEGYGLSTKGIDNLLSSKPYTLVPKPSLLLTVDHGITAREEVDYAKKKGFDVIITDHHQPPAGGPKKLPKPYATIWTDKLSGAGVAWILAKELTKSTHNSQPTTHNYLDLVAIATIADILPLKGPNRSLVKFGLEALNKTQRVGLLAIIKEAGLTLGKIGTWEVSFVITPRLNASGRIEHAMDSLRLLCTRNPQKATVLAQKLNQVNLERQRLTEEAFSHARTLVSASSKLIFISHPSYNEGVVGLVAGRLSEEFYRPAVVVSEGKTRSKASARSINGFNIIEALRKSEELLVDCGGHPMAAGFTVETVQLAKLKSRLLETAQKEITPQQLQKTLKIDCEVNLEDINWALYDELSKFEPFGAGNPEPVFLTRQLTVRDIRVLGNDGKHLKLLVEPPSPKPSTLNPNAYFSAIGFGLGDWGQKLKVGDRIDLVYTILVDSWNGEERLQLKIKDLKPS